ncbi:E3 ubiquitin-protein ligase [Lipomyces oligophaga]|uniref:E3 ubiquitin-protein ligase n=1 Tax=Lipomyces oligophaga TaxID=45792 RepID=UPI0034CE0091
MDITDASDWKTTIAPELSNLDSGLRCRICRDFFSAPMMAECSHSFCSLCIRRSIATTPRSEEPKCPICRASVVEVRLRRNQSLEELVQWFKTARKGLLEVTARPQQQVQQNSESKLAPLQDEREVKEGTAIAKISAESGNLVVCPVCNKPMTEEKVIQHIDECLSTNSSTTIQTATSSITPSSGLRLNKSIQSTRKDRGDIVLKALPKIQYGIINESRLRSKLQDLGIPSHGTKPQLQNRHTEWVSIWNANIDSVQPKSKKELLQDLSEWELTVNVPTTKIANLDSELWNRSYRSEFDLLIARAKQSNTVNTVYSENTDLTSHDDQSMNQLKEDIEENIGQDIKPDAAPDAISSTVPSKRSLEID